MIQAVPDTVHNKRYFIMRLQETEWPTAVMMSRPSVKLFLTKHNGWLPSIYSLVVTSVQTTLIKPTFVFTPKLKMET